MNYSHAQFEYAGMLLDGFLTEDNRCWITLSSMADGLSCNRMSSINWLRRQSLPITDVLDVQLGIRKVPAKAYPVSVIVEFVSYRANRGDKYAQSLLTAVLQADLERSVQERNGKEVTALQHEQTRYKTRIEHLNKLIDYNYDVYGRQQRFDNYFSPTDLTEEEIIKMGVTDPAEIEYMQNEAYLKVKEVRVERDYQYHMKNNPNGYMPRSQFFAERMAGGLNKRQQLQSQLARI